MSQEDLTFQIVDWDHFHDENMQGEKVYTIRIFGKTKEDKNVYLQVEDFCPFFYIEIDEKWRTSSVHDIIEEVQKRVYPKDNISGLKGQKMIQKYKFDGFTNYKKFNYLLLTFKSLDAMKAYERAFSKRLRVLSISRKPIKFRLYESNIIPYIRFMHIRQLNSVGWVNVKKEKLKTFDIDPTTCHINYRCNWSAVDRVDDNDIRKLKIASFDIECVSEDKITFPKPERDGDKVIQIGITYSRFGESECYERRIFTLNKTANVPGAKVEWFETEEEVLLAFSKAIRETDPDIITGYNIFGFDFKYLMERSRKLGIYTKFSRLSRIKNEVCDFIEQNLSSSALGDNILKYYKMTGRVLIDLMKVVQRDHKLPSYKLDFVASSFIKSDTLDIEPLFDIDCTNIKTKSSAGVVVGQYITLNYYDSITENLYKDGAKYQIVALTKNTITVRGMIDRDELYPYFSTTNKKCKVWWCQAKDDVSAQDIFRMQDEGSKERAKIAKYCLMDCELCNKIVAKLQIIANNIGMANVCNVPLSFLFLRGQGVKIFSLVAKKCREKEHLIPVIKKKQKKDEKEQGAIEKTIDSIIRHVNKTKWNDEDESDDEDEGGYEGATVFPPEKAVHYEPIPVLDFSSLYPNAMILRNLSHEMHVNDPAYDKLPGYIYHTITYRNDDETTTTCRFAERADGIKGIIPEILSDLLSARKKYKKLQDDESDPFKKAIWEGLQLAYKITANSLYGQTGAPTSPIYRKVIAASTTATGREMLQYSKYFIEEIYLDLILKALDDKEKYLKTIRKVYEYYPTQIAPDIHVHSVEKTPIPESRFFRMNPDTKEPLYSNREEMFEVFYQLIKILLKDKGLDMKGVYGDSVTGETPIIIRYRKDDKYVIDIKTIEQLGKSWKSYDAFKSDDHSLSGKAMDDTVDFEVWSDKGWSKVKKVIRHKTSKDIYEVLTDTGYVRVTEDHSLLSPNCKQIKPKDCRIGTELLHGFPDISNDSIDVDTDFDRNLYDRLITDGHILGIKTQLEAQKLYALFKSMNHNINIRIHNNRDDSNSFDIIHNLNASERNIHNIKKIQKIGPSMDYVYDLETESGHFHAGIGELIVKNTDSIFFKTIITDSDGTILRDKVALKIAIQLGIWGSILITTLLPPPMAQEYEKVMWPLILLTKKRYVGNLYEKDPDSYYQKCMGIVLKRRDNAPIVKVVCGNIIDQIVNKRDSEGAVKIAREILKRIITGKYNMDKFIITKTLRGTYSGTKKTTEYDDNKKLIGKAGEKGVWKWFDVDCPLAHVALAQRLGERDPGNMPESNDRIPFVYIETKEEVKLQGDRIENPDYLVQHGLKTDYLFYITNQIMKPATQFLELIVENPEKIFKEYIIKEENRKKSMMPIDYYIQAGEDEGKISFDDFVEEKIERVKEISPKQVKKIIRKAPRKKKTPIMTSNVPDVIDESGFVSFE